MEMRVHADREGWSEQPERERNRDKIIFFDHASILSGGERSLLEILRAYPWDGCEPILVLPSEGELSEKATELGVRVEFVPVNALVLARRRDEMGLLSSALDFFRLIPAIYRLRRILGRERAYLLVTNSQKAHIIGALASFLTKTRLVWYFRDILPGRMRRVLLVLGLLPDGIIAISEAVAAQFWQAWRRQGKVVIVPNGIDLEGIRRAAGSRQSVLKEFGLPLQSRLVGAVGQITRWKGQRNLIEAAKLLEERFEDLRLLIVGDVLFGEDSYRDELRRFVADLGLTHKVIFTGYRADASALINGLDVLVHTPDEPEPFGRVLVEAMALAKAVVASKCGAIPEIVSDRETGILIPPGDPQALARALGGLLARPRAAREMGRRGRERVERLYSIGRLVRDLEPIFAIGGGEKCGSRTTSYRGKR